MDDMLFAPVPQPVEVVSGHAVVAAQVEARATELSQCSPRTRATFVRMRVKLRWSARGGVRAVAVSSPGGAAFARCVQRALRGALVSPTGRAGSGSAAVILRRTIIRTGPTPPPPAPEPTPMPAPEPAPRVPSTATLQQCTVDTDCTIHFRTHACISSDPVAVNKSDMTAVRDAYPVRRIDCAMGGPQYMELLMRNEGRYSAACEVSRCVVRDAGPRPTGPTGATRPGEL
jgi:hypothetical protein